METLHNTYDAMERLLTTYQRDGSFGLFSMHWYIGAVSKHAEGMSLRYDAICALAYCGWHKSSQTKANQKNRPFGLHIRVK